MMGEFIVVAAAGAGFWALLRFFEWRARIVRSLTGGKRFVRRNTGMSDRFIHVHRMHPLK